MRNLHNRPAESRRMGGMANTSIADTPKSRPAAVAAVEQVLLARLGAVSGHTRAAHAHGPSSGTHSEPLAHWPRPGSAGGGACRRRRADRCLDFERPRVSRLECRPDTKLHYPLLPPQPWVERRIAPPPRGFSGARAALPLDERAQMRCGRSERRVALGDAQAHERERRRLGIKGREWNRSDARLGE